MSFYTGEELSALYELGRLYYEMGYISAADRIFSGLAAVAPQETPARLGMGVCRVEKGAFQDALHLFRFELREGRRTVQAKLGMVAACLSAGDRDRARQLLGESYRELSALGDPELRALFEAFSLRARE